MTHTEQIRFIRHVGLYVLLIVTLFGLIPRTVRWIDAQRSATTTRRLSDAYQRSVVTLTTEGELSMRVADAAGILTALDAPPDTSRVSEGIATIYAFMKAGTDTSDSPASLQADIRIFNERLRWLSESLPLISRLASYEFTSEFGPARSDHEVREAAYYARKGIQDVSRTLYPIPPLGMSVTSCEQSLDAAVASLESFLRALVSLSDVARSVGIAVTCARSLQHELTDPAFTRALIPESGAQWISAQ